nr:mediator of RNA polymerase II transcription subunit 1 [Ipomoea batatas]
MGDSSAAPQLSTDAFNCKKQVAGNEEMATTNGGDSFNCKKHLAGNCELCLEEEEIAFLRSLGWEENGDEDDEEGDLTEEEIAAFYTYLLKLLTPHPRVPRHIAQSTEQSMAERALRRRNHPIPIVDHHPRTVSAWTSDNVNAILNLRRHVLANASCAEHVSAALQPEHLLALFPLRANLTEHLRRFALFSFSLYLHDLHGSHRHSLHFYDHQRRLRDAMILKAVVLHFLHRDSGINGGINKTLIAIQRNGSTSPQLYGWLGCQGLGAHWNVEARSLCELVTPCSLTSLLGSRNLEGLLSLRVSSQLHHADPSSDSKYEPNLGWSDHIDDEDYVEQIKHRLRGSRASKQ